jgi:solute carrier family 25 (mitochondrial dicarboxylate transporter), member 10
MGLFDGISGTWLRQMSYSMCRFWAYDESKKVLGAGKDAPAWKLAAAGSMGTCFLVFFFFFLSHYMCAAGGIAGLVGNPGGPSLASSYRSCD